MGLVNHQNPAALTVGEAGTIIVIYDGECGFCNSALLCLQQKLSLSAEPFQSADLGKFGLTKQQCAQQVYVIFGEKTFSGAAAVGFLLRARGNTSMAWLIKSSGGLARFGYRWVASHRNSWVVKVMKFILDRSNSKSG